jgi:hypothetical protein
VIGPGTETVGAVESTRATVTVNVAVPVLVPSLAEHVTVVVPTGKVEPDAGAQLTGGEPATASVAEALPYVTVVPAGLPVVTLSLAGGVTAGGVVSTTCTVNEPSGRHVTGVFPRGKSEPEAGLQERRPAS